MAKQSAKPGQLPTHGASVLPSVEVKSYNVEIEDEDGFIGDKAEQGRVLGHSRQMAQAAAEARRGSARRQAQRGYRQEEAR